jgi:hypothetical protein
MALQRIEAAHDARSSGAKRQAEYRARKKEAVTSDVTRNGDVTHNAPSPPFPSPTSSPSFSPIPPITTPSPPLTLFPSLCHDVATSSDGQDSLEEVSKPPPQEPTDFAEFWDTYPKRDGTRDRKGAVKAFRAALKRASPQEIIAAAHAYAEDMKARGKADSEFVAKAQTWLNGDRWNENVGRTNGTSKTGLSAERLAELRKIMAE